MTREFKGALIGITVLGMGLSGLACRSAKAPALVRLHGRTMGTTWSASVVARPGAGAPERLIQGALDRVDSLMSTYKPDSELMRFNNNPSTDPVPVSNDLVQVMKVALQVAQQSGGALDVTLRPVVELWGFGASSGGGGEPSPEALAAVAGRVGYRRLHLDEAAGTLQKIQGDVTCDLSAVAKGYGVDLACRALSDAGYSAYLVEVGGELRSRGEHPEGRPWTVAVEKPDPDRRETTISIPLEDMAAATSGSYRNFIESGGKRLSHIIDPRTLAPVGHNLVSVTVLHPSTAVADAWATALMVLGPEGGIQKAQEMGLPAYFIAQEADGTLTTRATEAWAAWTNPPTP